MSDTAKLLTDLSRLSSVEALTVGDGDHTAEVVPPWCELVLNLEDERGTRQLHLTRHDAELIIEVLHEVLHPGTHRSSPVQRIWGHLDEIMDYLMGDDDPEPEDKAAARAYATSLAYLTKPYSAEDDLDENINEIRAIAVQRWEDRP